MPFPLDLRQPMSPAPAPAEAPPDSPPDPPVPALPHFAVRPAERPAEARSDEAKIKRRVEELNQLVHAKQQRLLVTPRSQRDALRRELDELEAEAARDGLPSFFSTATDKPPQREPADPIAEAIAEADAGSSRCFLSQLRTWEDIASPESQPARQESPPLSPAQRIKCSHHMENRIRLHNELRQLARGSQPSDDDPGDVDAMSDAQVHTALCEYMMQHDERMVQGLASMSSGTKRAYLRQSFKIKPRGKPASQRSPVMAELVAQAVGRQVPERHLAVLLKEPSAKMRGDFDVAYGPGAADKVLQAVREAKQRRTN